MATIQVIDKEGKKIEDLNVKDEIFDITVNDQVIYDSVRYFMFKLRSGTASTLIRSEVQGTGAKHHRQKGTGMARAGSARVPHWRGGGVAFGPKPKDFSIKINKKVRKLALRGALSEKLREKKILVVDDFNIETVKTKDFEKMLEKMGKFISVLFVVPEYDEKLFRASRNIAWVSLMTPKYLNVYECLVADHIIFTKSAIQKFQEEAK
ncbi:MAG: 50S ribosomal protein L4 [bacterium]|nr:50S ribosomal protein L4 [bacterium]